MFITTAAKWGNSIAIRIPQALAKKIQIDVDTPIELNLKKDKIVIKKQAQNLEKMLAKITPENLHQEIKTGPITGKEIW